MPTRPAKNTKTVSKPFNLILLGDPAAGKATQSELLVKKYHMYDFDMGKELMELRTKNKDIDERLKHNTDKGQLTPTQIVRNIHHSTIGYINPSQGILFDGHPKMLGEAKLASRLLKKHSRTAPLVIYITIPLSVTVKRMHDRKGYFAGKFGKRADDSDSALKNRVRYYRTNIAQVVEYFKSQYTFKKISGLGTPLEVHRRIVKIIESNTDK